MRKNLQLFASLILAFSADQLTKFIAQSMELVTINPGISYGLFSGFSRAGMLIMLLVFFAGITKLTWEWWQKHLIIFGLFSGSVLSNMWDRIMVGGVRDFLPVPFLGLENNLADWVIFVCLALAVKYYITQSGSAGNSHL